MTNQHPATGPERIAIQRGLLPVTNTKLAAALLTVGVPFARDHDPVENRYSEQKPERPGQPGQVTYLLASQTAAEVSAAELAEAYQKQEADRELDTLLEELSRAVAGTPAEPLVARLRRLLPFALICYLRGVLENRERILDMWKKAVPMYFFRRGPQSFSLVSKNASPETKRRLGIRS